MLHACIERVPVRASYKALAPQFFQLIDQWPQVHFDVVTGDVGPRNNNGTMKEDCFMNIYEIRLYTTIATSHIL